MKKLAHIISVSLAVLLLLVVSGQVAAQSPGTVQLSAVPLPLHWENQPISYSSSGNRLVIEAGAKTDMFRDPNVTYNTDNAPKLMFRTSQDFIITACVSHRFTNKWDAGALVLRRDSLNWVKFAFEKDYKGKRRVVSVVTKDISDDANSIAVGTDSVWLKMARAGNVITLYCATDGRNWLLVRHFQFTPGEVQAGFLAQSPTGDRCRVVFSSIRYEQKTIKDPYTAE